MRASRTYGSVPGAPSNGRPYRDFMPRAGRDGRPAFRQKAPTAQLLVLGQMSRVISLFYQ